MGKEEEEREIVLCGVIGYEGGFKVYYGRGVKSGEWYSGVESEVAGWLEGIALAEGERVIKHPYGVLLFRHGWLMENGPCELVARLKELEEVFEQHPPQTG